MPTPRVCEEVTTATPFQRQGNGSWGHVLKVTQGGKNGARTIVSLGFKSWENLAGSGGVAGPGGVTRS